MLPFLIAIAIAEVPLPSYEDELSKKAEHRIEELMAQGDADQALAEAETFQRQITDTAQVSYLVGLIHNRAGRIDQAISAYQRSIALNGDLPEAWYDLGELLMIQASFDEAAVAFAKATELYPSGKDSWRSPLRQAEVAGHQRSPDEFESHLKMALRRGFSFRDIEGQPQWQTFYADPLLRDPLTKMVTVYGRPETLDTLIPPERRAAETP